MRRRVVARNSGTATEVTDVVRRAELHFHLLPSVDDGPKSMAEALELARAAVRDGTGDVVATPHVSEADPAALAGQVDELRARLREAGVPLRVHSGGELHPEDVGALSPDELAAFAVGPARARWLLLEAPLVGSAEPLEPTASKLQGRGYGIVLAHPERSPGLYELDADAVLRRTIGRGARVLANASSVTGDHGEDARQRVFELIRAGLVHGVASDAHRLERGPILTPARAELLEACGEQVARALVDEGPRALLERGVEVPAAA